MSAFIVDEFTMHRALMGAWYASERRGFPDAAEMTRLGKKWFEMNAQAVTERYGSRADVELPDYKFRNIAPRHPADYLKALCCLQYQCAEGDVPESTEYQELTQIIGRCSTRLIRTYVPAYELAPWDGEGDRVRPCGSVTPIVAA